MNFFYQAVIGQGHRIELGDKFRHSLADNCIFIAEGKPDYFSKVQFVVIILRQMFEKHTDAVNRLDDSSLRVVPATA